MGNFGTFNGTAKAETALEAGIQDSKGWVLGLKFKIKVSRLQFGPWGWNLELRLRFRLQG